MVRVVSCCYFFNLREGCFIAGIWLVLYYSLFTYLMYYQEKHSTKAKFNVRTQRYDKETYPFLVLGTVFILLSLISSFLVIGAYLRKTWPILLFLLGHIIPLSVKFFYLLVAIIFGINFESTVMYLLPFLLLMYIDLIAYSFYHELKGTRRKTSVSLIHVEY